MRKRPCLIASVAVGLVVLLSVSLVVYAVKRSAAPPPAWIASPPADNAFDEYVRAAALLDSRGVQAHPFLGGAGGPAERAKLVADNADVLDILSAAADDECAVSPDPSGGLDPRLGQARELARFIAVAVEDRADVGEPDEALRVGVDGIAMGVGLEHGTIIWCLVGGACESIAIRAVDPVADNVSPQAARTAARRLMGMDARAPTFDEVRGAEVHYYHPPLWARSALRPVYESAEKKLRRFAAQRRAFAAKLAVIAYQHDHSALPADLNALVPDYLDAVPVDPFDQAPLRYATPSGGFVVYSIGPDLQDGGGVPLTFGGQYPPPGDICSGVPAQQYQPTRK